MQTEQEAKQWRPFHETIIDAIRQASLSELVCLGKLINATKIPKGHDEIIAAWVQRKDELFNQLFQGAGGGRDVPANLLKRKHEAEKEAKEQMAAAISAERKRF